MFGAAGNDRRGSVHAANVALSNDIFGALRLWARKFDRLNSLPFWQHDMWTLAAQLKASRVVPSQLILNPFPSPHRLYLTGGDEGAQHVEPLLDPAGLPFRIAQIYTQNS